MKKFILIILIFSSFNVYTENRDFEEKLCIESKKCMTRCLDDGLRNFPNLRKFFKGRYEHDTGMGGKLSSCEYKCNQTKYCNRMNIKSE
jgi:hypothetical protein